MYPTQHLASQCLLAFKSGNGHSLQLQSFGNSSLIMLQDLEKPQTQIEIYQIKIAYEQLILQTMSTSPEIELTIVQFIMLIL
jgi:hypothetical protein